MTDQELHEKLAKYGKNAKHWARKIKLILPEIQKRKLWQGRGFTSLTEMVKKLTGLSHDQITSSIYVMKKIKDKPALLKVAREKGLNAVKPVVAMATAENQEMLAEKARTMSHHTLRAYVRDLKNENTEPQEEISIKISKKLAIKLKKLKGDQDWESLIAELIDTKETQHRQNAPAPIQTESRHIPKHIKHHVLQRSNGYCEHPNCIHKYTELHHTNRFSESKIHDPNQIVALCKQHHQLAHHGLIKNETQNPQKWQTLTNPSQTKADKKAQQHYMLC